MVATEQSAAIDAGKPWDLPSGLPVRSAPFLNTALVVTGDRAWPVPGLRDPRDGVLPGRPRGGHLDRRVGGPLACAIGLQPRPVMLTGAT